MCVCVCMCTEISQHQKWQTKQNNKEHPDFFLSGETISFYFRIENKTKKFFFFKIKKKLFFRELLVIEENKN